MDPTITWDRQLLQRSATAGSVQKKCTEMSHHRGDLDCEASYAETKQSARVYSGEKKISLAEKLKLI